jgi:hypothetical protein
MRSRFSISSKESSSGSAMIRGVRIRPYKGRYYCDSCLAEAVKDPEDRKRLGLPPLTKGRDRQAGNVSRR